MVFHRRRGAGSTSSVFAARQELPSAPVGWEAASWRQRRLWEAALLKIQHCETSGTSTSLRRRLELQDVCFTLTWPASPPIARASSSSSSSLPGNLFQRREQEEKGWGPQKGQGMMHVLAYMSVWGAAGKGGGSSVTECPALKGGRRPFLTPINHGNFFWRVGVTKLGKMGLFPCPTAGSGKF